MSDYAFYPAWNTALNLLHNAENHFGSRNRVAPGRESLPVSLRSSLIDPFPVRLQPLSGGERGDGFVPHDWILTLAIYGYKFLVDTYFASETVTEAKWTIYTRRHLLADFKRYNCKAILPSAANGDITLLRGDAFNGVVQVRLRFRDLIAI